MATPKAKFKGEGNMPTKYPSKFKGEGNMPKKTPSVKFTGGLAKVLKPIKAAPMTPEDATMFKLLQKRYPDLYPKKKPGLKK